MKQTNVDMKVASVRSFANDQVLVGFNAIGKPVEVRLVADPNKAGFKQPSEMKYAATIIGRFIDMKVLKIGLHSLGIYLHSVPANLQAQVAADWPGHRLYNGDDTAVVAGLVSERYQGGLLGIAPLTWRDDAHREFVAEKNPSGIYLVKFSEDGERLYASTNRHAEEGRDKAEMAFMAAQNILKGTNYRVPIFYNFREDGSELSLEAWLSEVMATLVLAETDLPAAQERRMSLREGATIRNQVFQQVSVEARTGQINVEQPVTQPLTFMSADIEVKLEPGRRYQVLDKTGKHIVHKEFVYDTAAMIDRSAQILVARGCKFVAL